MTLQHFGHASNAAGKALHRIGAVVGEHHVYETQQIEADRLPVDDRRVVSDHALRFEFLEALLKPGPRQPKAPRQLRAAGPPVVLQLGQQAPIEAVETRPAAARVW